MHDLMRALEAGQRLVASQEDKPSFNHPRNLAELRDLYLKTQEVAKTFGTQHLFKAGDVVTFKDHMADRNVLPGHPLVILRVLRDPRFDLEKPYESHYRLSTYDVIYAFLNDQGTLLHHYGDSRRLRPLDCPTEAEVDEERELREKAGEIAGKIKDLAVPEQVTLTPAVDAGEKLCEEVYPGEPLDGIDVRCFPYGLDQNGHPATQEAINEMYGILTEQPPERPGVIQNRRGSPRQGFWGTPDGAWLLWSVHELPDAPAWATHLYVFNLELKKEQGDA